MCSWKTFTVTFRGKLHEKENIKCQDSAYGSNSGDIVILALSDGAGSARLSHIGSKIVVNTFAELLKSNFEKFYRDEYPYKVIIERINKNFSKNAIKYGVEPKEFSATLVGLAMKDNQYFFIHIGDGIAAYYSDKLEILSIGVFGEYANETVFVNSENIDNNQLVVKKGIIDSNTRAFLIMSDGASKIFYDKKKEEFAPAVMKILDWLNKYDVKQVKKSLLHSLSRLPPHYVFDDFSLGIVWRGRV